MGAARAEDLGANPGGGATERFVRAGLELLELDADETELAVIEAADRLYRPVIESLLQAELYEVEREPRVDMSRAPE